MSSAVLIELEAPACLPSESASDLLSSTVGDVVADAQACARRLGSLVGSLDPAVLQGHQASALVEAFSRIERLSSAGRTLAAGAAQRAGSWKSEGDRSAAHWMARKAGVPVGQAIASLETASRLEELTEVSSALRTGKLSVLQVNEVASAAATDPTAQSALLTKAATENISGLREAARKIKAAADPNEVETYKAIHRRRYLRHWTDPNGAMRLEGLLTPDAGARFVANLDAFRAEVFKAARAADVRDSYDAYAADALVNMAEASANQGTTKTTKGPTAVINVHVDHSALVRGHTKTGETCEIPGIGSIPVAIAREMANDAFLKVLVTDGADIKAVAHAGRSIPAHIRTALNNRDTTCCVPGCNTRQGLEIDHIKPFAEGGATTLDNLARLCHWHHRQKTLGGWQLGGKPGEWAWRGPP